MLVTPLPIVTTERLVQCEKAESPMEVTLSGMAMLVKAEQLENIPSPIEESEFPNVTL